MLAVSEMALSQLLRQLDNKQSVRLLGSLSDGLGAFSAQRTSSPKHIHQPLRSSIVTDAGDTTLFMPVSDTATTGIKVVTVPAQGNIEGVINVLSPAGKLLGILSAAEVTAFRTALATMTLLTRCTTLSKNHLLIFGSGRQAEWHVRLALLLFTGEVSSVTFINRGQKRLDTMLSELLPDLQQRYNSIKFTAFSKEREPDYDARLQTEISSSDVISCCTPSTEPLFPYAYLRKSPKQRFISLIGSYKPHMQEIDTDTLLSGGDKIYVDSKEACLEESGELVRAKVTESQLVEIGELFVPGSTYGRVTPSTDVNVVFKCVGMGIMDLAVAKTLLTMAGELNIGTQVDGF
jgi:ornithine cyclodeaminase/alanine dehydrogenase-like protein (mu-crystallin family)